MTKIERYVRFEHTTYHITESGQVYLSLRNPFSAVDYIDVGNPIDKDKARLIRLQGKQFDPLEGH